MGNKLKCDKSENQRGIILAGFPDLTDTLEKPG